MINVDDFIAFCNPISVSGNPPETAGRLRFDSREITPGDTFIAIKGTQTDGHNYIQDADEKGAAIIISEKSKPVPNTAFLVQVKNTQELLSPLAQKMAGNPAQKLRIVGITGTNGKTTVATLVWQILRKLDFKTGLLGTVSKKINDRDVKSRLTTADPVELAEDMKQMVDAGCEYLVMEVSSHALHQKRVHSIPFEIAAFTNLSLDHLDYHQTMEDYASAKKILFDSLDASNWAVVNMDDPYGPKLVKDTEARVLGFSFSQKEMVLITVNELTAEGTSLNLEGIELKTPLIGLFNAYNTAQAVLICSALGFDGKIVAEKLQNCTGAPGRMEKVLHPTHPDEHPIVVVDYAHTPDALKNVASTLSELKDNDQSLAIVFGCGGDRDKSKRPKMARISEKYASHIYVTSDNPRTEDPEQIIRDIMKGFSSGSTPVAITSREMAIQKAIAESDSKTIVLVAGKGHETYQEIYGKRNHFDDREIALSALKQRNGSDNQEVS